MGIALFDFSLFTIVVSVGLVAVALANPSPVASETPWDGIAPIAPPPYAQLTPSLDSETDRFIIAP